MHLHNTDLCLSIYPLTPHCITLTPEWPQGFNYLGTLDVLSRVCAHSSHRQFSHSLKLSGHTRVFITLIQRKLSLCTLKLIPHSLGIAYRGSSLVCYSVTYLAGQERRLNTFHLRSIRRILGISRQDKEPTLMSCLVLVSPVCTLYLDNGDGDGWDMSVVWRMVAFQKTSSTGSWLWGGEPPAALTCDIKTSA